MSVDTRRAAPSPAMAKGDLANGERALTATPLAQRVASARGLALASVVGSGNEGTVRLADVDPRRPVRRRGDPRPDSPLDPSSCSAGEALASAGQNTRFHLAVRCCLDPLLALKQQLNEGLQARGVTLATRDLLLKATAMAMEGVPEVRDSGAGAPGHTDIAVEVGREDGVALGVISNVGGLSLSAIADQADAFPVTGSADVRPAAHAAFIDLSSFAIDSVASVPDRPQPLVVAIGGSRRSAGDVDGAPLGKTVMAVTASVDQRVISSVAAARFLAAFRTIVEAPLLLCS